MAKPVKTGSLVKSGPPYAQIKAERDDFKKRMEEAIAERDALVTQSMALQQQCNALISQNQNFGAALMSGTMLLASASQHIGACQSLLARPVLGNITSQTLNQDAQAPPLIQPPPTVSAAPVSKQPVPETPKVRQPVAGPDDTEPEGPDELELPDDDEDLDKLLPDHVRRQNRV